MSISSRLWIRCFDTALASATSPFLISLSQGNLAKSSFKAYIAQDAFYLVSFKQAFASAATICRKDSDGFGVDHFENLEVLIEDELKMHAKFALDLNIDLTSVSPFPQTLLYTDFLGEASKTNHVSHICAAMTPCMTLYGFLGRRAKTAGLSVPSNPYSRWIDEYSSPEFGANAERLEMLLDHFAKKDDQKFEDLIKLYAKAMELEYNFFSAHETPNWTGLTPGFLGIDFDDTISAGDTISHLCRAGLRAQGKSDDAEYKQLLAKYSSGYEEFMSSNLPSSLPSSQPQSGNPSTPSPSQYRSGELSQFMQSYSTFEDSMLSPVIDAQLLKGLSSQSISAVAESVPMKLDAIDTIRFATQYYPGMEAHILSVNWSKMFLQSMMKHNWPHSRIPVHANELTGLHEDASSSSSSKGEGVEAVSTGSIERSLTGPTQKGELLRSLLKANIRSPDSPSVYIGDSLGDLTALLEADIGIVIGTSSSLRRVCAAYGVTLKSLDALVLQSPAARLVQDAFSPTLYFAESWAHIGFCLFGKGYVASWLQSFVSEISSGAREDRGDKEELPTVMSVAGSDSGGGAGIQADIKTCCAFNVFSTTALTCLTAQNTRGVTSVTQTSPEMLRAQLDAVLGDIGTGALKTGMIPSAALAVEITRAVTKYALTNVVVDPVMVSTSGSLLMDPSQARDIVRALFPVATVVTPNVPEALAILRLIHPASALQVHSVEDMEAAAKEIYELGSAYVLVKGGHLASSNVTGQMVDVLYDGQRFTHIKGPLIQTANVHGTGCTLSTAIACELAKGSTVVQAVRSARAYLTQVLRLSAPSSIGTGDHGPMLHMAPHFQNATTRDRDEVATRDVPRQLNPVDLSLYAVTDSTLNEKLGHKMEDVVAAAVAGGATIVQLREKNITTQEFVAMSRRVLLITRKAGVPLIINDRVDVALAIGADGVHVGQSDMSAHEVRRLIGPNMILGVSTKSCKEALQAQADGADYVGTGAVYPTNTKVVTRELGVSGLKEVCRTPGLFIPVVAIGGIAGEERIRACLQVGGADGIAVVSAIFGERDVLGATAALSALVKMAMPAKGVEETKGREELEVSTSN